MSVVTAIIYTNYSFQEITGEKREKADLFDMHMTII